MKNHIEKRNTITHQLNTALLLVTLTLPSLALAAPITLATAPLTTSTTSSVKPNLMFIIDDSGSMNWNYLPDWAGSNGHSGGQLPNPFTNQFYDNEPPLFKNNGFNGIAYNPATTYIKPVFYNANGTLDTTTYPDMLSPWTAVRRDGYGVQSPATTTDNLVGNASHFVFVFGEYCSSSKMNACVSSTAPITFAGIYYSVPAKLRWCNSAALTTCQSINNAIYMWPRYPGQVISVAAATTKITVTATGSATSIKVNGFEILKGTASGGSTKNTALAIAANINSCTASIVAPCTIAGYSATVSNSTVTITAPISLGNIAYSPIALGTMSYTTSAFSGGVTGTSVPGSNIFTNIVSTTNSYPYPGTTSKASTRTDCLGTTCTYNEEMNNYANWWAYYQTRMQALKTSSGRAFKNIDNNYRVGFSTINDIAATNGPTFLGNNTFELTHKNTWYTRLYAANATASTPLRGALSKAGRYYANKLNGQVDPVQYSCQQNFSILSTDGYWNTGAETSGIFGPINLLGVNVGNQDAAATTNRPLREGATPVFDTLADVAKYYYDTDLRTSLLNNCAGASSTDFLTGNPNVCDNNVFVSPTDTQTQQHMTTFTMGLGADGTLNYTSDYDTATTGDYYNLKNGTGNPVVNWSDPIVGTSGERIDDLWHAAVNGRGKYFSAKNPDDIVAGFTQALSSINAKIGSAAAAATSTLNPVAGNNFAYVASYTSVKWTGNLESRTIDTSTGVVSESVGTGPGSWCVENVLPATCTAPSSVVASTSGNSTIYNCVTPGSTISTCSGVFDSSANTCSVEINHTCTGTLPPKVAAVTDTRKIYTSNGTALVNFDAAYATANPTNFSAAHINTLSQWSTLTTAQQSMATGVNLINFLRGQNGFENRSANADKLYRFREAVLGDALESQPSYTSKPVFNYAYPGYNTYATNQATRAGTVYMGTNDGMMHAFAADTGIERWAYVPTTVIPNMWQLADTNYATKHRNFVNGSPVISDICAANCTNNATAVWKTILVSGLNGGGRGYFALDITDPVTPVLLWEFTDSNLGYSYGNPVITRLANGKWVVVMASGYNNINTGDGVGRLFILDANTGGPEASINDGSGSGKISSGVGDTVTPSGLAKISIWNDEPSGNLAGYIYGGDLLGNVWRFNLNTSSVIKFATLLDPSNVAQPITTSPSLGLISGKRVVFIGTGKYLEISDLTTQQIQTQYAIKDDDSNITFVNPRNSLVQQTLTLANNGANRSSSNNLVDFATGRGWYVNLPDKSTAGNTERVNIDSKLVQGVLLVPTIIPSNTVCSPGGYGWLNYFGYDTGSTTSGYASIKYDSPIVGTNIIYINNKPIVSVVTSAHPTPDQPTSTPKFKDQTGKFSGTRWLWREFNP